jgi:hypothetical protein
MGFDKIKSITFENFRGLEFFQKSLFGNKHFAYVKTTIDYEIDGDSIGIQALFHPSSSFVYNKKIFSKDLLTHELYHFRITELYARIAKARISVLNGADEETAERVIDEVKKEENSYQIRYDDDTFHSYVLSEQKKYERNVDSLLDLQSKYKDFKIKFR